MLKFKNRKVQQVRGSFFIPLPPEWITSNGIKKSDPVRIELLNDGSLKICPVPKSDQGSQGTGTPTATIIQRRSAGYGK
jgi:antitoxin component of MazEF toxin-antitoxin module